METWCGRSVRGVMQAAEEALTDCQRRFKNLSDRHVASVKGLGRNHFKANRLAVR